MEKETRTRIQNATQAIRRLLESEFTDQLEGTFDILRSGRIGESVAHLDDRQQFVRERIVAAIRHKEARGMKPQEAVADYIRDASFTTLNRFAALKMLEARELVRECVSRGEESAGYKEFCGLAPVLPLLPEQQGYRLYLESIFDELTSEIKVLFDRRDAASQLWPGRQALAELLEQLNTPALAPVWGDDETIGWVYQYFNADADREKARYDENGKPKAPQNSRELAVRNQFFTPRYVVQFLVDNTLGRTWKEMRRGETMLVETCQYMVRREHERYLEAGVEPDAEEDVRFRAKKDPRDLRILDPACGSGHFLLYSFDLLLTIYQEAWNDSASPISEGTGRTLRENYKTIDELRNAVPGLILGHNLFGVEIDPRCAQIAALALWMRAQRAFADFGIGRHDRPPIRRTNIVVAEPMPGEKDLRAAFIRSLDAKLGRLVARIIDSLETAGELGSLLKIEEAIDEAIRELNPGGGPLLQRINDQRWQLAEEELLAALHRYATEDRNGETFRRQLFADDAAIGLALIDVLRRRYDVVVMNPPFGDPTASTKDYVDRKYPASRQDVFAVFVERAARDLVPGGFVGVISTEAGFFRRTLESWRREVLLEGTSMTTLAHLGGHVLDGATVRTAAYVLATGEPLLESLFVRVLRQDRRAERLMAAVRNPDESIDVFKTAQSEFEKLPYAVFGYWCSAELRNAFKTLAPLQANSGVVRQGLATADDFRFLRLRWELTAERIGAANWLPFAKGGEYSPFHDDVHLLLNWKNEGAEIIAWGKGRPQNTEQFGKPGLTYPLRTNKRFAPRALPAGSAFGHKGPAIVDVSGSLYALLAFLNSRPASYLLSLSIGTSDAEGGAGANSYEVGIVQRLPIPKETSSDATLDSLGREAWLTRAERDLADETCALFVSPTAPFSLGTGNLVEVTSALEGRQRVLDQRYVELQRAIDCRAVELYGFGDQDWREIEEQVGDVHHPPVTFPDSVDLAVKVTQFLVGSAFGRWNPDVLSRSVDLMANDPFAEIPLHKDTSAGVAVFTDDAGARSDLLARIADVASGVGLDGLIDSIGRILQPAGGIREWLRAEFFEEHRRRHSKSRRSAPIYWQLAPPSARYSIWLYAHRFTHDSFFQIQKDMVEPKLMHEESELARLVREAGPIPTSDQRKAIAAEETFVEELRAFRDEIARVAPLWNPNLDDGVVITSAPLWRLFPHHKAWQNELKSYWDELCAGKYDWSHLAMHLWPERVVSICATDRSVAIAHGLEDVFWVEDTKGKWTRRSKPTRPIEELVAERTSPAVKAALKSLIEAPIASAPSRRRRS